MKLKQWQNIFHVIVNTNSIVQRVIQIKNGITNHVNVSVKLSQVQKDYIWNPSTCICKNSKYLKSMATNVSINSDCKQIRYCYIVHAVLLAIILIFIITIISYYHEKHRSKEKTLM